MGDNKRSKYFPARSCAPPVQLEASKNHNSELQDKYSGALQRLARNARQKLQERKAEKVKNIRMF